MPFEAYQIQLNHEQHREAVVNELSSVASSPFLVLNTCQRIECYGFCEPRHDHIQTTHLGSEEQAFRRIARITAGLESRIVGELEVLGQVRRAYRIFLRASKGEHSLLDRVFQDALALGREARRVSGVDATMTSLSGLTSRELMARVPASGPVAVVGSGSLAGSVARHLKKRGNFPVRIASRCPDNALNLALEVGGFSASLDNLMPLLKDVTGIVTATAAPHPVLYPCHLEKSARPLTIIDLGAPADCDPGVTELEDVTYIGLETIEQKAHINTGARLERAKVASRIIEEGVQTWARRQ